MSLFDPLSLPPPETARVAGGAAVQFRRARGPGAGDAITHVLLHGIGSASASWLAQLHAVRTGTRPATHVLAWDAPGYGASTALALDAPTAADYAQRMWAWLDALGAQRNPPIALVGHSLGALIGAAAAAMAPQRIQRLVLLAPAPGYARAPADTRAKKLADRLAALASLGPAGLARQRASALLSAHADADQLAFVEQVMAAIDPAGYAQAARMLAGADLLADLQRLSCPVTIASGAADSITPAQGCEALAQQIAAPYLSLGAVGHACNLEAAVQVNRLLGLAGNGA